MQSDDLTRRQCEVLKARIAPMLRYLNKLHARMVKRGFLYSDPLLIQVGKAKREIHNLYVELHYLSVEHGVGKLPTRPVDQNRKPDSPA